jgi:hypothetical protein
MGALVFLLAVAALTAAKLAARLAVLNGRFDDLPPIPRED